MTPLSDQMPLRPLALPAGAAEGLGFYVYALRDPRDGAVFYVGKGTGERVYDHVRAALGGRATPRHSAGAHPGADPAVESAKNARIRAITAAGYTVEHLILRSGLDSDEHAYLVEQAVLDGYAATGVLATQLTNLVGGHHSATHGLASVEAAAARVAAPVAAPFPAPAVIFMINRAWRPDASPAAVYAATRGHWRIGTAARGRVVHVYGVAGGIIRGAYTPTEWVPSPLPGEQGRWGFHGAPAADVAAWVGASVRHLVPERGAQNPVRIFL